MKKLNKSVLALFLAGAMAFMPTAETLAVENADAGNTNVIVLETEENAPDTGFAETKPETEESGNTGDTVNGTYTGDNADTALEPGDNSDTDSNSGNDSDSDPKTDANSDSENDTNSETDADTESDSKNDDDTNSETDADTDSDSENNDDTDADSENDADSEIDADTETDTDSDSEAATEEEFPGLKNSALSSRQLQDKKELADHLDEITKGTEGTDFVSGELIFAAETLAEAEKITAAYGGSLKDFGDGIGVMLLPEGISVSHALTVAAKSTDVVLPPAWPNHIYKMCSDADEIVYDEVSSDESSDESYLNENAYENAIKAYNDPFLASTNNPYQYQHTMVGSTYAWNAGYTGDGIKIAILDTGVSAHTDLNVVYNYNFSIENLDSASATANPSDTNDKDGHGTHVAGLAAAKNNSIGGAGIAPKADIYNIRVLNSEGACTAAISIRGINHAVEKKVDIINMSLGGAGYNKLYSDAIKKAYESGIAVFAAAGNDGGKLKSYPACYSAAISVGAVQENKGRAYFSNYGPWVKFSAPGTYLYSTSISNKYSEEIGGAIYQSMSGTSQATPIISGTAAVILSADESIRNKSGKARVDALISKMNKGKIAGNGGAASIVSIPKALDISVSTAAPKPPVFETTDKTITSESLNVSIKTSATDTIYYSIDGKNITYKNGILSDNAVKYTGPFSVGGQSKATVKAIAVNACGLASKAASITYTFKPPVSGVTITGQSTLLKGKSATLKATVTPDYAANKKVTWTSSDPSAVKVSSSGKVTATSTAAEGMYTITATSTDADKIEGKFKVTVKAAAKVGAVAFKNKDGKVLKNATITKAANEAYDDLFVNVTNGSIDDVDFTSSNAKVAVVDNTNAEGTNVHIVIKGSGKAVITAMANDGSGKKATFALTVKKPVTSLTINGFSQLSVGKSIKLAAAVNSDAANKAANWKISPEGKGVTINKGNGTVKATKTATVGSYTVTAEAKDGHGATATKTITVSDSAITQIKLDKKSGTIFRIPGDHKSGTTIDITADIKAQTSSKAAASSTAVEFTSSNPGIATVTQDGATATITATGKMAGTTKITCKAADGSGKSATCTIKVVNPPSNLTIAPPASSDGFVAVGKTIKLSAVFEEEFGSVSSKAVTWESADKDVATIDANGNVKGIAKGAARITATAKDGSGLSASYKVFVCDPIKKLKIKGFWEGHFITVFDKGKYTTYILYNDATYADNYNAGKDIFDYVSIEIGNPDIMYVEQLSYGIITLHALKKGSTTITIKALDGTGVSKTYKIKVN